VAIGDAVTAAKLAYLQQLSKLSGIDEKSVAQFTIYGLPMFAVNLGTKRLQPPGPVTPQQLTPGSSTGLAFANVAPSYTLTANNLQLPVIDATTGKPTTTLQTVTYYDAGTDASGLQNLQAEPFEPFLPLVVKPVPGASFIQGANNYGSPVARGVVLTSATFTDVTGFKPLVDVASTESIGVHPNYVTAVRTPVRPFGINSLTDQSLYLTPMQYISNGNSSSGIARRFDSMSVRVYYTGLTGPAATAGAPVIYNTSVTSGTSSAGNTLHIEVLAGARASAGIEDIWAAYAIGGTWTAVQLTRGTPQATTSGSDALVVNYTSSPDIALGTTAGESVPVFIQAVGGTGLVSYATNNGAYYFATGATSVTAPPKLTSLTLTAPSSANYLDSIAVSATLKDAAGGIGGKPVVFSLGDLRAFATTDASGVASAQLPVRAQPGSIYAVSASFDGDALFQAAPTATKDITVSKLIPTIAVSSPLVLAPRGFLATLKAGARGLNEQPMTVQVGSAQTALITDSYGRLMLNTSDLNLGPGCQTATVDYAGNDRYNAAAQVSASLVVPAPATIALTSGVGARPIGPITVSATVVQSAGPTCDPTKATLTYELRDPVTGTTYTRSGGVSPTGTSSTTFPSVAAGLYTIQITVGGYLTGSFSTTADHPLPVYDPARWAAGAGQLPTTSSTIGLPGNQMIAFGFASYYPTSAITPSGAFGFYVQDPTTFGVLNAFGISAGGSFDWLVVTPKRAVLQGTGTLDGVANQKFRLEVRILSNGNQTVEVHVWDPTATSGKVFSSPKIRFSDVFTPTQRDDGTGVGLIFG
jgi:hypothetical protein